jgi:hypothetical protein
MVVSWLNDAQLKFSDQSEILRGVWEVTVGSDGKALLPDDFLREVIGRVSWNDERFLGKSAYADLSNTFIVSSSTNWYALWGGYFYVFAPATGDAVVPYIRKTEEVLVGEYLSADLDIPTEYHIHLIDYLDAMWARNQDNLQMYSQLMEKFEQKAKQAGMKNTIRIDAHNTRASRF